MGRTRGLQKTQRDHTRRLRRRATLAALLAASIALSPAFAGSATAATAPPPLAGRVLIDTDGDGAPSTGDTPASGVSIEGSCSDVALPPLMANGSFTLDGQGCTSLALRISAPIGAVLGVFVDGTSLAGTTDESAFVSQAIALDGRPVDILIAAAPPSSEPAPPAEEPPAEEPPATEPPAEEPPAEQPPSVDPEAPDSPQAPVTTDPDPPAVDRDDEAAPPSGPVAEPLEDIGILSVTATAISVVADGTAVFDANNDPGNDSSATNGIVRTNDTVQYQFQFNTDGPSTNPHIESTLPAGMRWQAAPPQCTGTGTTPHPTGVYDSVTGLPGGDRRLLVCQLPSSANAQTTSISPIAQVTTASQQGEVKSVTFSAADGTGSTQTSTAADVTVSAGPFFDMVKNSLTGFNAATGPGAAGTQAGIIKTYGIGIKLTHPTRTGDQALKGLSALSSPLTFTDDLTAYSPNAQLMNWGSGGTGCGTNDIASGPLPFGFIGAGHTATNSVPNSGAVTCAQSGQSIQMTVTGLDSSGTSFPTQSSSGSPLVATDRWVAAYKITVWLPVQDVLNGADGTPGTADDNNLTVTNRTTNFDPTDLSGQSNYGAGTESLANNSVAGTLNTGNGWGKSYRNFTNNSQALPTSSGINAGDGRMSIGSRMRSIVNTTLGALGASALTLCDVFDNSSMRLVAGGDLGTASPASIGAHTGTAIIEYGAPVSPPTTFAAMRATTCADSDATWSQNPADAALGGGLTPNGYRDTIDRVRVRLLSPQPAAAFVPLFTGLEVYAESTLDPAANPEGTWLTNFGHVTFNGSTWAGNTYNPLTNNNTNGDRVLLVPGQVRVSKTVVEQSPGSGNQVGAGTDAHFRLAPSVTTNGSPGDPMTDVTVTDIVPNTTPRMTVNPLSVSRPAGVGVELCSICDGSDWSPTGTGALHGVRWLFGAVIPGTALPSVDFTARVPVDAANAQQYSNTAVASATNDPSPLAQRSSTAGVQVIAAATVLATKSAPEAFRPLAGPLTWNLTVRNNTSSMITRLDVIDVLPFSGDARTPASAYSGDFSAIATGALPSGMLAYVTTTAPATLDSQDGQTNGYADPGSPGSAWYTTPGTGSWTCLVSQIGTAGCPDAASVTAIRFTTPEGAATQVLPPSTTVNWTLSLTPTGDVTGDVYTNRYQARVNPEVLALPVVAPDVPIAVIAPEMQLVKQTCTSGIISCNPADDAVWAETNTVGGGDEGVFRLTVTNTGTEVGDVTVTDTLPAGLTYVAGTAVASTGDASGFPGSWSIPAMTPGATATLVFSATIPAVGTQTNSAEAIISDRFAQTASDDDDSQLTAVLPAVGLDKQTCTETSAAACDPTDDAVWAETNTVGEGDGGIFRLTVTNTGTEAGDATVTDALPAGLTYVSGSATASAGDATGFPGAWTVPGLAPGATATLVFTAAIPAVGAQTNTASVILTDRFEQTATDEDDSQLVAVLPAVDLEKQTCTAATAAACDPTDNAVWGETNTVGEGDKGVFRLTVTNTGTEAGDVTVTDGLPAGLTFVPGSATASAGDATGFPGAWTIPAMAPGATATLVFEATIPGSGTQSNTASVTLTDEFGQTATDDDDSQLAAVAPAVDLDKQTCTAAAAAACDPTDDSVWGESTTVPQGAEGVFRLTVTNTGPETGDVTVTDPLPSGLTYVTGTAVASAGDASGFPGAWTIPGLAPSESATLVFHVVVPAPGTQTNTAAATITDRFDQTASDEDPAEIDAIAPIVTIEKNLLSSTVDASGVGTITYELVVSNGGTVPATYDLDDTLSFPVGVVITSSSIAPIDPTTLPVSATWDGASDTTAASDVPLAVEEVHRYAVSVEVLVPLGLTDAQNSCEAGGGFANTASVSGDGFTADADTCADVPGSGVQVRKTGSASAQAGAATTWSIEVTNTGALDLVDIAVTDPLPKDARFASASDGGTLSDGVVAWSIPAIPVGGSVVVTVTATIAATATGEMVNCATGSMPPPPTLAFAAPLAAEETSCVTTTITPPPPSPPTPTPPAPPAPSGLSSTGVDGDGALQAAAVGFALLLIGAGLTARRRRRSTR